MLYPNKIIKQGSKEVEAVNEIKKRLNKLMNVNFNVINGIFGPTTEEVVKQFQRTRNLLDDGIVGKLTWEKLFEEIPLPIPVSAKTLPERAIEIAKTQLHVREKTGRNDGEAVESYLKSVGLGKGYAWCAAFVYWCYSQAAKELNINNPLAKTAGVLDHWAKTKGAKVKTPKVGDIFIMDFGKGAGHTGIVIEVQGTYVITIEGNTSADPTYASQDREGDGVYIRRRRISSIKGFIRY